MLSKLTVLCFSPTGGTRAAADAVAAALSANCETIDLLRPVSPRTFSADEVVLIAMPVFGGRIPGFALDQLKAFQGGSARAVTLAVYGNRAFDDALVELNDAAAANGFHVIASAAPVAEHSMVRSIAAGRPDSQDKTELAGYAAKILAKLDRGDDSVPTVPGSHPGKAEAGAPWAPVVSEACVRCGKCAAECPVGAIPADAPNTTDASRCIHCMRCTVVCPTDARTLAAPMAEKLTGFLTQCAGGRRENELYL